MPTQDPGTRPQAGAAVADRRIVPSLVDTPKALFLAAAFLSFLMSVYLFFSGDAERGIFVGIWVPSILSLGTLLMGDSARE